MFFGGMQIRIKIFYCDAKSDPLLTWEAEQKAEWSKSRIGRRADEQKKKLLLIYTG